MSNTRFENSNQAPALDQFADYIEVIRNLTPSMIANPTAIDTRLVMVAKDDLRIC